MKIGNYYEIIEIIRGKTCNIVVFCISRNKHQPKVYTFLDQLYDSCVGDWDFPINAMYLEVLEERKRYDEFDGLLFPFTFPKARLDGFEKFLKFVSDEKYVIDGVEKLKGQSVDESTYYGVRKVKAEYRYLYDF